jgi:hypothetical protein
MKKILELADSLYWTGKETGLSDEVYDKLSEATGHTSKPPATLKGWAQYPDYCLAVPNFGLKKVSWEIARKAIRYWPKHDGIFLQTFSDEKGDHWVTRGNGRTGKDLASLIRTPAPIPGVVFEYELLYSVKEGGRAQLCADICKGFLKPGAWWLKSHVCTGTEAGHPPREIPAEWNCTPCDGWVIQLADGQKFAYKGEAL